jgi:hypothetical protein
MLRSVTTGGNEAESEERNGMFISAAAGGNKEESEGERLHA